MGRNRETWQKRGLAAASERFDYLYSEDELAELAAPIKTLSEKAGSIHVLLNTNYEDQGQSESVPPAEPVPVPVE